MLTLKLLMNSLKAVFLVFSFTHTEMLALRPGRSGLGNLRTTYPGRKLCKIFLGLNGLKARSVEFVRIDLVLLRENITAENALVVFVRPAHLLGLRYRNLASRKW